jgi:hypothetical protein
MNGVSAGVTQGQGRRPLYAPPLHSRRPLLRPPIRVRTGFMPMQGHSRRPFTPRLLRQNAYISFLDFYLSRVLLQSVT